jgi:hypothetical protein
MHSIILNRVVLRSGTISFWMCPCIRNASKQVPAHK